MNIYHCFGRVAAAQPEAPAVYLGDRVLLSFAALEDAALRLAAGLREAGLTPGDRVGVAMSNGRACVEIMLGAWAAGLCLVPMNAKLHEREFAYSLGHSGARMCFTDRAHAEVLNRSAASTGDGCRVVCVEDEDFVRLHASERSGIAAVAPSDPGWIFYTSGTTGRPKGATLSHRNLWQMTLTFMIDAGPFDQRSRTLAVAPLSHASGLLLPAYLGRGGAVVIPESGGFDPAETVELINALGSAHMFAAPTMVKRFIEADSISRLDVSKLDTIVYGGGPMYVADTLKALHAIGPRMWQIYGQGETPCTISYLSRERHAESGHPRFMERLASVGEVRTGIRMEVVGEDGAPVPPGTIGQIAVRGETVMSGYWNDARASAEALHDGWLMTGDLGVLDDDGFLTLKDRSKDLIISGGSNIYPREIEEVLLTHPGLREAAVIGVPHPEWGEEAVAFVVSDGKGGPPGPSVAELDRLCLDNIARFKRPKRYLFVDELPKSHYGKILKAELRRTLLSDVTPGAPR